MPRDPFHTLQTFGTGSMLIGRLHSLPALEDAGLGRISRLPVSIRIVLESLLRNCDGERVTEAHVRQLATWAPKAPRAAEIPFVVARIVLQDFTGVPLLCDLAAMRDAAGRFGKDPKIVEPLVPVDLVVDHSVQVDHYGSVGALDLNMKLEFARNAERYRFIKWGMQAFDTFKVVPPGIGIVHQVNLETLARGVLQTDGVYYPDTLVGTDSHTTMINALGVVAWGVGGIEAEAGMLGQPIFFLTPDVVGVHLHGRLAPGVTATDLVLRVTETLRGANVVGKFVEFYGEGAASLTLPDRATLANMAPEYGATMGFFPPDGETVRYLAATGRSSAEVEAFRAYFSAQGMFGMPHHGDIDYSDVIEIDLASVVPALAGPKRPQDRIDLPDMKTRFHEVFARPRSARDAYAPAPIDNGDVLIAAITSCTNTSNPGVMLAAGLLARKAVEKGLSVPPHVKTSLAPGSRVVTAYLRNAGLLPFLERLGFQVVAYGCTTCIGNAGPLAPEIEAAISDKDLVCAAVLSGNRNFEARIHPALKANYLASPPLVVAFAIAGRADIDLTREPLGRGPDGSWVYLHDIWPEPDEIARLMRFASDPEIYRELYGNTAQGNPLWNEVRTSGGQTYGWSESTYIARPPFFDDFASQPGRLADVHGARALAIFGDSVTTDHISPAGSIKPRSPAGAYLQEKGVAIGDFNSYGSRRGNHEVMIRGTFANVRIRNLMLLPNADGSPVEGGLTRFQPGDEVLPIYDAAMRYVAQGTPTVIFAGEEYGTGSSRDWAAKGTRLLGVKAVVARSFERIHRANLAGMGVLPLQFKGDDTVRSLGIRGDESFDILGIAEEEGALQPLQDVTLLITRPDGEQRRITLLLRIDTPIELDYLRHGGILPYVLRGLLAA
ncbi:MAG: aconitate hydratase AcnA [Candidatus Accumulibacter sp.]|nr:aconitate hydratase AcnA [Accumulibacter sp.]MBA4093753.1 aconitate hydratase AcnA [Accumulibacter sp.]